LWRWREQHQLEVGDTEVAKRTMQAADALREVKPTRFRKQHNKVERHDGQIQDSAGRPGAPFRVIDTLATMHRNGTITSAEYAAAIRFRDDFASGSFPDVRAASLERVGTGQPGGMTGSQMDARNRVNAAMKALGGHGSRGGTCAWFVLGTGMSIRDWALREGWNGQTLHQHFASGILVAAIGALKSHYGY
jgi:hypothetical protein